MLEVPIAGTAIIGRVLAHGRDRDTIWQIESAELDRREEVVGHGSEPCCVSLGETA